MSEVNHRFIQTSGTRMHLAEQGSGPLVVLLQATPRYTAACYTIGGVWAGFRYLNERKGALQSFCDPSDTYAARNSARQWRGGGPPGAHMASAIFPRG
jgi:hypothetical protein